MCRRFGTLLQCEQEEFLVHMTYEDGTKCSETAAHKIQAPGNNQKEII
jgi:hypothetical protein